MPDAKKYKSIKNDPKRLDHKRKQNAKWIKKERSRHPFNHYKNDFHHRKKIEIDSFEFWKIAKRQKLICPLTGRKLTGNTMSIDHIMPISKGGSNDTSNLQFVHVDVNYAKRNLYQQDFIQLCKEVVNNTISVSSTRL